MIVRIAVSLAAATGSYLLLVYWRGFFPQHAVFAALAVGALVWVAFRTAVQQRELLRRRRRR
jgi:hypothetical protein